MKNIGKRVAALWISAALVISCAACGKGDRKKTNTSPTETTDTVRDGQEADNTVSVIPFDDSDEEDTVTTTMPPKTTATQKTTATKKETTATVKATTTTTAAKTSQEPKDSDFVRVRDYLPETAVELMYATDKNFTGEVIYDFSEAWLRYGTVRKLQKAQKRLTKQGYRIKIWDAFRPVSAQFKLWEICPDPKYVANPNKGFSSHSRGNTVDITLVDSDGAELPMPTGFDDFTPLADRDYSDVTDQTALANVTLLEQTMKACGFKPYAGEWWHFSDNDVYDVAKDFEPKD